MVQSFFVKYQQCFLTANTKKLPPKCEPRFSSMIGDWSTEFLNRWEQRKVYAFEWELVEGRQGVYSKSSHMTKNMKHSLALLIFY